VTEVASPPRRLRVLHLTGSPTSELLADVSRLYAADCLAATADPERYEPYVAYVSAGGRWHFPPGLAPDQVEAALAGPGLSTAAALQHLEHLSIDLVVPQMFCLPGMTDYRALLDVLGLPYVGNRPDVMAIGADKARARALVAAGGVRVPEGVVVRTDDPVDGVDLPSLPVVVKPVDADNSVGVTLVREVADLAPAIAAAAEHGDRVLVERYVELGREVRCGVVDLRSTGGDLRVLPLEEYAVHPDTKPIRGYDDKLARGEDGELGLVAKDADHAWIVPDDDPVVPVVAEAALAAYDALGCRHYGLFDFRIDPDGTPYFLEAGLYCSYATGSVVVVMARAAGIDLPDLFATAVADVTGVDLAPDPATTRR